jgi:hypothetical protein
MTSKPCSIASLRTSVRAAVVAGLAASGVWGAAAAAGQSSSSFEVSVTLLPANTNSCMSGGGAGAPQMTCQPPGATPPGVAGGSRPDVMVLGYRQRGAMLKVAEPFVELADESRAWADSDTLVLGDYSSRVVVVGALRYVEMTVSW